MFTQASPRPIRRGGVVGLSLGRFAFVGAGVAVILGLGAPAMAGPEGESVARGQARFHRNGNLTRIRATDGAIINYRSFDIGANERVRFVQPSRDARVLNRISGEAPTRIDGTLRANGNVYFVNPAGVMFGNGAIVDVGGIYAAAGSITDTDFINNVNHFSGVQGSVINDGSIRADGGVAALIGREVANRGVISADKGVVAMVSGEDVILQQRGSAIAVHVEGLARTPDQQTQGTGVDNSGEVSAKRGRALMVAGDMYSLAVNNSGSVRAASTRIEGQGNATVNVGGTIDARNAAPSGRGGRVDITANKVVINEARIDASGRSGGGAVNIGGEFQGTGALPTSQTTLVSSGSEIRADATQSGDGGRVVVWSDGHTGFYGRASADGGRLAGDGGLVETSGKDTLDIRGGRVTARAKSDTGANGAWLLDPRNVTIQNAGTAGGSFDGGNPDTFTPNADDAIVDVADIQAALDSVTDVQIITGATGTQDGNITVADAISKTTGGNATLTLRAANDVNVNADITSTSGQLTVELLANNSGAGNDDLNLAAGSVNLAAGVTITTNGGDFVARGAGFAADAASTVNAGAGLADIDVDGGVSLGAVSAGSMTVTATGGDITQTAPLAITGAADFLARNGTGGEIFLTDAANTFGGPVTLTSRLGDDSGVGDGDLRVTAAGVLPIAGITSTGDVLVTADDLDITGTIRGDSNVTIATLTPGTDIFLGGTGAGLSLSAAEMAFLDTNNTLHIGASDSGAISIGADGAIDLSGSSLTRFTLEGGAVTFSEGLTLPDDATATFLTGAIDGSNTETDLTIGGMNGSLVLMTSGGVDMDTAVGRVAADLAAGSLTLRNDGNLRIGMIDALSGVTVAANENVDITADGGLTVNFDVTATGTGAVRLAATGGDSGNLIVNADVRADDGSVTLEADHNVTVNTATIRSLNSDVTITADADGMSSGDPTDGGALNLTTNATVEAGGAVILGAGGDMDLDATLSAASFQLDAGGDVNLRTDINASDAMGVSIIAGGTLTVAASNSINSSGNPISLTVGDLDLLGTINAGMGNVAIEIADVGTIGVGEATGDLTVSNAELMQIIANQLSIGGPNATLITVDGVTKPAIEDIGTVVIDATRDGARAVFSGSSSVFNALTVNADDGIDLNASVSAEVGDIILDADADNSADTDDALNIALGVTLTTRPGGGNIVISAANGGVVGAGALTIDAFGDLIINHDVEAVGIVGLFAGGAMTLGGTVTGNTVMLEAGNGISVAQDLVSQSGEVRIDADSDADGTGTLVVDAAATIRSNGNSVRIVAADIQLDGAIDAETGDVFIARANAGSIGLGVGAGDLSLSAPELSRITADSLHLGNSLTTLVTADGVMAADTAGIASLFEITTDDIAIDGALQYNPGRLSIVRGTAGTIGLGAAAGDLTIDNAEFERIVAGALMIGGGLTTDITVSGVTAGASAGVGGLTTLRATDTITFSSGASTFRALSAQADQLVRVNANLTTTIGDLTLNGDADGGGMGTNGVTFSNNRTLTSAGAINLHAGTGELVGSGALTLNAAEGISITRSLTTAGDTVLNADTDGDGGVLSVALGATIDTSSALLTIIASDLELNGSIISGAGETRIRRGSAGSIGLGNATGTDMTISGAELQRIIATGLVIGDNQATRIVVNGVTAANTSAIAGGVTLDALANGGQVQFNGAASTFGALTINADNGIRVQAQLSTNAGNLVFNPNADGAGDSLDAVVLADDVSAGANNDVSFEGSVRVAQNVIVSGNNVRFRGTVRSQNLPRTLTVNTFRDGVTLFERRVGGGGRPLAALTTNADGVTRIGADITTSGGTMTFNDRVRVLRNVTLTDTGGTGIFFNNTLNAGEGASPVLSLMWRNTNLPGDNTLPIVSFTGDVGAARPFEAIHFNFDETLGVDGRVHPPRIATIIARPRNASGQIVTTGGYAIEFNTTGAFHMGQNEKLTVAGDLTINAGSAVLGDISALGDITVNSPSIAINSRLPGVILGPGNTLAADLGVDIVSGGEIAFSTVPTVNGPRRVAFATPDGTGDATGNLTGFVFQAFGPVEPGFINTGTAPNFTTLDLRAEGPTNTNVADALAGAIPRETRFNDVGADPTVGQAQIEELRQLGIIPRTLDLPELLQLMVGWGLYNDYPSDLGAGPDAYTTAVNRLPGEHVTALLADYDRLFNRDLVDEDGNPVLDENGNPRRVSRASEIQDALYQSVRRYLAAHPGATSIDPIAFREYLDTSADETVSRGYVEQLQSFLHRLEFLGLTERELALSKNVLLAPVRPRGIATIQQFEAVIRGSEMATTGN